MSANELWDWMANYKPPRRDWFRYADCAARDHRPRSSSKAGYCACRAFVTFEFVDHL